MNNHPKRIEEVNAPLRAPHGEVVYELIGRAAEHGGTTLHSLAQIRLPPGKASRRHYHLRSEESYYVLRGRGRLVLDGVSSVLEAGEAALILPGQRHQIFNDGAEALEFLAVCAPAWEGEDSIEEEEESLER